MKTVNVFVALLFAMSCTKPVSTEMAHNEESVDSTVAYDTTSTLNEGESEYKEEETNDNSESGDLSLVEESLFYAELENKIMYDSKPYYYLNIFDEGETEPFSESDVTLYFDVKFSVLYYREELKTDDLIRVTEFLLQDDSVVCSSEEKSGAEKSTTLVCRDFGGVKITDINGGKDQARERLPKSYLNSKREVIDQCIEVLKESLIDAEVEEFSENLYVIKITTDDGTKVAMVKIEKVLYEKLMN